MANMDRFYRKVAKVFSKESKCSEKSNIPMLRELHRKLSDSPHDNKEKVNQWTKPTDGLSGGGTS